MIIGYVGTPGSGKTYEAVKVILSKLQCGKKVFTNIDGLNDPSCREAIRTYCGLSDLAIETQLKILEEAQLEDFWNHISPESIIVLDEVQKIFSSRDWQSQKNKDFGYWASTHRHYGFEVILITQNPERIDSAVRALFEWTYVFRKVNFLGSAVSNKYLCYCYAGDDTSGPLLRKTVENYDRRVFLCYQSYVSKDIKEHGLRKQVNVLRHPIFYSIPIVFCITLYLLFGKSTFLTGDLFGAKKVQQEFTDKQNKKNTQQKEGKGFSKSISRIDQENGIPLFSNR